MELQTIISNHIYFNLCERQIVIFNKHVKPKLKLMKYIFCGIVFLFFTASQLLARIEKTNWRDWSDCTLISNKHYEIIICASTGGRVLLFSIDGKNIIYENDS